MADQLILPRPGSSFEPRAPIPAPSEEVFTSTFGALLPRAQYITTPAGKAAYYTFPATNPGFPPSGSKIPKKILLVHGVQTPALGLLPLISALRSSFPSTEFATLDLWGHGLSATPFLPHEGALFHGLIDAVLAELGWKNESGVGLVGYSFGAVLTMGYLTSFPCAASVDSFVLVAPAGLVRASCFSDDEKALLAPSCLPQDEARARDFVVATLEGDPLPIKVPENWQVKVARGEVVAQAVKEWEMKNHAGHAASVVGVFRDGGVIDNDQLFVEAKKLGLPALVVLGENDGLSTEKGIADFGFDVKVVLAAGHAVVRENAVEVAEYISQFWLAM
ncbi:hypothetical protein E8E12_005456 [Didymella heteroderae]|uniref:AB hydrolase-1 domain-containing protein n=1 Tax=Didymella heteroderae TaxID=1769908 RepID=A0A9P4WP77_9PLEO|nr:hypothetical protein E8E12_005456 [Didymella heteroderae]